MKIFEHKKLFLPTMTMILFLLGFENAGFQLALLSAAEEFSLSEDAMGLLVAAQYVSMGVMPLLFGRLADRAGKKKIIIIFMLVFAAGSVMAGLPGTVVLFTAGVSVIGAGFSVSECTVAAALADAYEERSEKYINFANVFFGIGAVVSPLVLQALMDRSPGSWRAVFLICALAIAIVVPFLVFSRFKPTLPVAAVGQKPKFGSIMLLLSFIFCMFVYVGIENGIAFYADAIFVLELDAPAFGAYAISLLWGFMAGARLFFGMRKKIPRLIVPVSLFALAGLMAGVMFCRDPALMLCLFAAAGVACGCVWPGIMSAATSRYPGATGAVASYLVVGGGFGGSFMPVAMGGVMVFTGTAGSFVIMVAGAVITGAIMLRAKRFDVEAR